MAECGPFNLVNQMALLIDAARAKRRGLRRGERDRK
jgi:hypothetical protein